LQSSREVIDNLLRRKPADRVGLTDNPWGYTLKKWTSQGMPADDKGNPVDAVEHFGFDMASVGGWFDWQPIRRQEQILEETETWKTVRNGAGAVLKWWKDHDGTPEHIDFAMTDRAVWEKEYKPHLLELDRERVNVKRAAGELARRKAQNKWTHYGHLFIWEIMRASMGDYTMYMSLVEDPEWIHDFNRTYTDMFKTYYKILIEEAGKPDGIWIYEDLGYKHRLFCSPQVLADVIFPYYAEMVAFFHSYDLPVVLHTCGYTEPALDLVVEAGFDGLNPMEAKAGNDTLKFAEGYADKLVFIGGLDARVLESGDRALIRSEVTKIVEGMKERGARYVYGSDHSVSTNVDYDDFQYAIEVYREHMAY